VAGAHGVQLPEAGLPVAEVKRCFPELLVGASRHSAIAAARAEQDGADLVVLGPIFATPGKQEHTLGLGPLSEASRMLSVPLYAIGGIDGDTAGQAMAAGTRGLAAIRAFSSALPLTQVVAELRGARP